MVGIKKYIRKNSTLAELVILLFGIVLAITGKSSTILSGIGCSIVASAVIVFMTDVLDGKDENDSVTHWGLERVYTTRGEINSSCDEYINQPRSLILLP